MHFLTAIHSDIGTVKKVNQDSLCLKVAQSTVGEVVLAIVCDGLGGLSKGELASKTVIEYFSSWFENVLPQRLQDGIVFKDIANEWKKNILYLNDKMAGYGEKHNVQLGTTIVAVLCVNNHMMVCNVGDSRCYYFQDDIKQITKDHTVVEKEIQEGKLTAEQAKNDPRKSTLLQCIGASPTVKPDFFEMDLHSGMVLLLCSDGFRHEVLPKELLGVLKSSVLLDETIMKTTLIDLTELNKQRGEKDNISSILIKAV